MGAGSGWMFRHTFLLCLDSATEATQSSLTPDTLRAPVHGAPVGKRIGGKVVLMGMRWCRQEMTNTAQRKTLHKSNWIYIN